MTIEDLAMVPLCIGAAIMLVTITLSNRMTGAGISDGDELLVDRSKHPQHGDIIVAVLDGELTVKRLDLTPAGVVLRAENAEHPDIVVPELSDLQIWGVALYCIHHLG